MTSARDLTPLLRPKSIAIVGASSRAETLAGRPLANLQRQKFAGPIYPVNPGRDEVGGLRCYPDLPSLPETPDLALIVAPNQHVLPALEACVARRIRAAIVISSGFAEVGGEGLRQQQRMRDLARASGMVLCGPNSIGLLNFVDSIPLSFTSSEDMDRRKPGRVALVSQSGGLMTSISNRAFDAGLGLTYGVATGNEADLTATEALEWLAEEGSSGAFMLIIEEIRDGPRFMALGQRLLELGKPIVAYKIGRTDTGGAAARSHTGALAGSYEALQGVFRQLGIIEALDLDDLVDLAGAAAAGRWPAGPNIAVMTGSGGAGAAAADRAEEVGMATPAFGPTSAERLRAFLPAFSSQAVENPFDATAQLIENSSTPAEVARIFLADPDIHSVIAVDPGNGPPGQLRAEGLVPVAQPSRKPVVQVALSGSQSAGMVKVMREANLPVFHSPGKAAEALAGLWRFGRAREVVAARSARVSLRPLPELPASPTEHDAKRLLAQFGIPVVEERVAASAEEAVAAAEELGYPVTVKVHSPDILHKTEAGGVRLGLVDAAAVRESFAAMPGPEVLVGRMVGVRLELIAGFHTDATFGPLVVFGLGGTWTETLRDVALRPAPLLSSDVREMASELRAAPLLRGSRGLPAVRMEELERILLAVSEIALAGAGKLGGLDINPLALTADGSLVALDAGLVTW
jgi:acyl-CoA synthetase (NDP forming)